MGIGWLRVRVQHRSLLTAVRKLFESRTQVGSGTSLDMARQAD